jgi:hypothetical protein
MGSFRKLGSDLSLPIQFKRETGLEAGFVNGSAMSTLISAFSKFHRSISTLTIYNDSKQVVLCLQGSWVIFCEELPKLFWLIRRFKHQSFLSEI